MEEIAISGDVILEDEVSIDGDIDMGGDVGVVGFESIIGSPYQNEQLRDALELKFDDEILPEMTNIEIEEIFKKVGLY
ncbi:hypothetical protein [Anaerorhabdus sp.]|uniref:hypothetical protein n=1 Tax=Anaerorhabdus sp. TaxID=1872524 RepID=UPI002FC8DAB6